MRKRLFLSIIFLLVLLAGCNNDKTPADNEETPNNEKKKVSIMLDWYPNAVHSYIYVAQEKGYFNEENVEVDIQFPANPTDPMNLTAAGKVTLGLYYQPDVILAQANEDIPIKAIASIVREPLNYTVMLEESSIQSPKDLEGKTIGYPGIPLNESLIKTMVTNDGGDYDKVNMIDVGFELESSLVSKRVDAVTGTFINHEVPVMNSKGFKTRYFNPVDYGVPNYSEIVLLTSDDTWDKEQDAIQAFWRAAQKGYEFMVEQPEEALDLLLSNQDQANFPLDKAIETESLNVLLPKMDTDGEAFGTLDETSWEEVRDWLHEMELIKTKPEVDDMILDVSTGDMFSKITK
ncbi:ABC transporter substrate-binding protein [Sporosarcina sp. P12(2017)]|uniref:ABC transporter substrate-binding protein n=1 Tax=unclassified Sporosarcina TaxID=2647733 RepID=UPI000C16CF57|nr:MULTISPECIES: ABC transporter substrate-binding protein [unclassified Sporosarcina]PIC58341.1 ABC transporter substrate-binding protein [Sporosarcina sp. P10]PIC61494.1 ABC transporter substrate-binding protein [Sporosarcina sp. P12(2017)]